MKRVSESVALGYIASRTVESILILVGVVSLMSVVGLRQDLADAANTSAAHVDVARGLLAVHDQTAILGPQLCAGLGNGILLPASIAWCRLERWTHTFMVEGSRLRVTIGPARGAGRLGDGR